MILDETYFSYINLAHRQDRNIRMQLELDRIGLKAERFEAIKTDSRNWDYSKTKVMRNRTAGAIGCHYSQVAVMEKAFEKNQHAGVLEDDLIFCSDFKDRMEIVNGFTNNNDWDIFWFGGTYHLEPTWHKSIRGRHLHPDIKNDCECTLNKDWEPVYTNHEIDKNIVRTYGCWSTYAYIVNFNSIEKILTLLEENVHRSMGIDWLFIKLQPQLKTFSFNPGMVKQYNNQSDIGEGITNFEGFSNLGSHWFKDKL